MTTGRPTIPIEQKRIKGTLRPDRLPNTPLPLNNNAEPPKPPEHLQDAGVAIWNTIWQCIWVSHTSDLPLVLFTAETIDERDHVKKALAESPDDRSLRVTLRELDKQYKACLSDLGFTPSDRSRLGVAEVKKETRLDELLRRRDEQRQRSGSGPGSV
jgi:hypothetical protein